MNNENQHKRVLPIDGTGSRMNGDELNHAKYSQDATNKETNDNEFPGYPHYPPSEDIMNPANHIERVPVNVENLAPTGKLPKKPETASGEPFAPAQSSTDDEIRIVPGTDADVTREDLRLLNATEGPYAETSNSTTVTGEDLDVPGADQDDPNEDIGEEDEENNYYSLGGDNHENLEEDPS